MQLVLQSLLVNYYRSGKGSSIVLLHGWGDAAKSLEALQESLSATHDVISLDLPGFGGTESPTQSWDLNDYAHFVGEFCDKLKLKPYAIVGHSNGGAIALRGLANRSLSAKRLVLLASAGIRGEYKGRVKALRLVTKTGKILTSPLPHRITKKLRSKVYAKVGSDMLVAEHLQETFKRIVSDDVRNDAAAISIPTLLMYGSKDEATPVSWGTLLHSRIRGSKMIVVPEAGHFLHHDAPALVAHDIMEFLK